MVGNMKAKQKAITQLQRECTPIKDENDFVYYATNNISFAIDIAIKEAKKEVIDDIDGYKDRKDCIFISDSDYKRFKERHTK